MEDPRFTKKLVKREIARIITPGTATEANLLRSHENNYLAAVAVEAAPRGRRACRCLDRRVSRHRDGRGRSRRRCSRTLNAREVLLDGECRCRGRVPAHDASMTGSSTTTMPNASLREHFKLLSLDGCGLAGKPLAVAAAGAILHYLRDTQRSALDHLDRPGLLRPRRTR